MEMLVYKTLKYITLFLASIRVSVSIAIYLSEQLFLF